MFRELKRAVRPLLTATTCLSFVSLAACGDAGDGPEAAVGEDAGADVSTLPVDASSNLPDAHDASALLTDSGPTGDAAFDAPDAAEGGPDAADAGCPGDEACPLGQLCVSGACVPGCSVAHGCAASATCCSGQCVDLTSNASDCAACGQACSSNNVPTPTCTASVCSGACATGFADCDQNLLTDGCETEISSSSTNCGACGVVCSSENVTPECTSGTCAGPCATGFADCDHDKQTNGCETNTLGDVGNCGSCGAACSTAHTASVACTAGTCTGTCVTGWQDCNQTFATDGCETNTQGDPENCGACGSACSVNHLTSVSCSSGQCEGTCAPGWGNCNGNMASDGCEQNTSSSAANCGGCGVVCPNSCVGGSCICRLGLPDAPVLPTVSRPVSIVTADFNGDGLPDIAEVSDQPKTGGGYVVRVYTNQGGATFTSTDYPTQAGGTSIVATGADGYVELAIAEPTAQALELLGSNGHGVFGTGSQIPLGDSPSYLAVANGEILAIDTYSDRLLTLGGGTTGPATGSEPVAIAAGDLDGDHVDDPVVVNMGDATVSVYASKSGGARTDYATAADPVSVALADLNGDGALDVIVGVGGSSFAVQVLLNDGGGKLAAPSSYPTPSRPVQLAAADFNEDGRIDVVCVNDFSGYTMSILFNQGSGALGGEIDYNSSNGPPSGTGVAVADFQGRGHADVALTGVVANAVYLFLGKGDGTMLRPPELSTGAGAISAAIGDVNGDGKLDVVGLNQDDRTLSVELSAGGRTFQAPATYPLMEANEPQQAMLGDLDGDGLLDVVASQGVGGQIAVFLNTKSAPGTLGAATSYPTSSMFGDISGFLATGDLDGDGDLDVAVANDNASIEVFFNDGHGGFAKLVSVNAGTDVEPTGIVLADVNNDHQLDIVAGAGGFLVFLNQGAGVFGAPTVYPMTGGLQEIAAGDLNGDGYVDLAGVASSEMVSGFLVVSLGSASGFSAVTTYPMTDLPVSVLMSDIDGDGRLDVVAASQNDTSGVVSVFLNAGGGTLGSRIDFSAPLGTEGIAARDLDGDGRTDVVATIDYNGGSGMYVLYGGCL